MEFFTNMPKGIYKHKSHHSKKHKEKIGLANKGKIRTLIMREKYRKSKIGNKNGCGNKGRKYTKETLEKMIKAKEGKHYSPTTEFKKGSYPSNGFKKGQMPWNYKGGISKQKGYSAIYKRRYRVRKYNAEGSHTFGEWENLKAQYNWTCPACGRSKSEIILSEDHIIPLSKGGSDNIENIQPLCCGCNSKKNTKTIKYET